MKHPISSGIQPSSTDARQKKKRLSVRTVCSTHAPPFPFQTCTHLDHNRMRPTSKSHVACEARTQAMLASPPRKKRGGISTFGPTADAAGSRGSGVLGLAFLFSPCSPTCRSHADTALGFRAWVADNARHVTCTPAFDWKTECAVAAPPPFPRLCLHCIGPPPPTSPALWPRALQLAPPVQLQISYRTPWSTVSCRTSLARFAPNHASSLPRGLHVLPAAGVSNHQLPQIFQISPVSVARLSRNEPSAHFDKAPASCMS